MENDAAKSMAVFFKCMSISMVVLSVKVLLVEKLSIQFIKVLFMTFMYCFTIAMWIGLASMFATDIYLYIKRKLKMKSL